MSLIIRYKKRNKRNSDSDIIKDWGGNDTILGILTKEINITKLSL